MTTTRTSTSTRRSFRGAALVLFTGAGLALTPLTASAHTTAPAASAPVAAVAPAAAPNSAAQVAVDTALAQVGDPYAWGAAGPNAFDCSGLTMFAYKAAGVDIPRTSRAQSTAGVAVAKADLKPGDLIFFYSPVSHMGMYVGNGLMVHSSTYGKPVSVMAVDSMPSYNTARRVV
mgnify:CR=1 FL=1